MKGLVDYGGSSSEESDSDAEEVAPTTDIGAELRARIPEARRIMKPHTYLRKSDQATSEAIPKRHDWELEMERELKRGTGASGLTKSASIAKRPRARIPALPNFNFSMAKDDEVEVDAKKARKVGDNGREEGSIPSTSSSTPSESRHGLLALLPQPKSQSSSIAGLQKLQSSSKPVTILLPPSIAKAKAQGVAPPKAASPPQIVVDDDKEEEGADGEEDDYFGLKSASAAGIGPSTAATYTLPPINPHVFMDEVEAGPSRPMPSPEVGPHLPSAGEPSPSSFNQRGKRGRLINDREASRLIYKMELAPFGAGSKEEASLAVESMVEVSVDQALGPNVRENLLRNLNNKSLAQVAAGPLPKVKKDPQMKLAKMKHQITHLAGLAVSREEQLQEKWAENRAKKKQSAQRYGF